jgi:hypothetical protein
MIYKIYQQDKSKFVIAVVLISTMIFPNPIFLNTVNARNMDPYRCVNLDDGTIGHVYCCAKDIDTGKAWCTTCDATNPPSNCSPAKQVNRENNENTNPKDSGWVLSSNDDGSGKSGIPKGIDPSTSGTFTEDNGNSDNSKDIDTSDVQEGGTFTEDNGNSDNQKGFDPNNSGGEFTFNQ